MSHIYIYIWVNDHRTNYTICWAGYVLFLQYPLYLHINIKGTVHHQSNITLPIFRTQIKLLIFTLNFPPFSFRVFEPCLGMNINKHQSSPLLMIYSIRERSLHMIWILSMIIEIFTLTPLGKKDIPLKFYQESKPGYH